MPFKYLLIATFGALLFINYSGTAATTAADLSQKKAEFLPLASFLYANRDPMRVGWYNTSSMPLEKDFKTDAKRPVGSFFVQLKPRKNEGEYQLALRVLRDGSHQFLLIREFTDGNTLNHKRYLTIPFKLLIGAIQGEALRSLFPNDHVEFGGWRHQVTYVWETPELLMKSFTRSGTQTILQKDFMQGEEYTIPWENLRSDLELEPLAVRDPLFIRKDKSGLRYAFYRIQPGDTLYSSVVIRFIGNIKHAARSQNASDLLVLNGLVDAHQLSPGQLIKIPLEWIRPEYLHQVPSIYRISEKTTSTEKVSPPEHQPSIENGRHKTGSYYRTQIISQR
ncbi:MAG: hypothetical protein DSY98_05945 [SAR324 cluster bacterium]|uniref:LysM domain-containing protein n=1 Tax=SAR324 cluster bacterium TaxID=2024889 RepID=A0A432G7Q7_9DELT|nr:MAG: hypothetical protein DSY98_05945 [SAR324 cluster bacterium]